MNYIHLDFYYYFLFFLFQMMLREALEVLLKADCYIPGIASPLIFL